MRHEITYRPTFAQLEVLLDRGETVRAEAGAMLGHSHGIDIRTATRGGFVQSLKRSVFGGESFFLNDFTAREPGSVTFAPRLPGDLISREVGDEPLFVQSSSFLAGTPGIDLDTKFGGFKTFFAGEGLFLLGLTGPGTAFLSSFGAIDERRLAPGERFVVDTGHVVAFEGSLPYSVRRVGGLRSTVLSGEGLVVEFEGPGTFWTQSRSPDAFLSWITSNVPSRGGAVVPADHSSDSSPAAAGFPGTEDRGHRARSTGADRAQQSGKSGGRQWRGNGGSQGSRGRGGPPRGGGSTKSAGSGSAGSRGGPSRSSGGRRSGKSR